MIQERDAEQVGSLPKTIGKDTILRTGRHIAGRMIMGTDPGYGIHQDERFEDLARMHNG